MRIALVGFVLCVLFSACAPKTCRPDTCNGCCTTEDLCQTGTADIACGLKGLACATCSATERCMAGSSPLFDSIAPSVLDAGACRTKCGPSNCAGCCAGDFCRTASTSLATNAENDSCGNNGSECADCTARTDGRVRCVNYACSQ